MSKPDDFHEICIVIVICKAIYHVENYEEFGEWVNNLILELPSKLNVKNIFKIALTKIKILNLKNYILLVTMQMKLFNGNLKYNSKHLSNHKVYNVKTIN